MNGTILDLSNKTQALIKLRYLITWTTLIDVKHNFDFSYTLVILETLVKTPLADQITFMVTERRAYHI